MNRIFSIKPLVITILCLVFTEAYSMPPEQILKISDEKLIPKICSYVLTIETVDENGKLKIEKNEGFKEGDSNNVLIVKQPKKIAGSVHLRKGQVIWSYFTTNKKLMKFAYQSIFMGSLLSYGDVMVTELSYDYQVVSMQEEDSLYRLTLEPKAGHEGYAKLVLSIDKQSLLPKKREYYAISGILLKSSEFTEIEIKDGVLVRMEQEFFEPLKKKKSTVRYENIKVLADIPDKYFNENFIKFLGGE